MAFDTVRHSCLMEKVAQLNVPDNTYNWLTDFLSGHSHCTRYRGRTSDLSEITASIILGSAIGPASYVVHAADLRTVTTGNCLIKYDDDTYVIIPACNVDSRQLEMDHIGEWSKRNNLALNWSKSAEIVFSDSRKRRSEEPPPPLPGIARVKSLKVLGVTISSSLSLNEHVDYIISSCARSLYAIKVLRAHGLCATAIQQVYKSVLVAKLLYASLAAWWGLHRLLIDNELKHYFVAVCVLDCIRHSRLPMK